MANSVDPDQSAVPSGSTRTYVFVKNLFCGCSLQLLAKGTLMSTLNVLMENCRNLYSKKPCREKTCFMLYANNKDADQPAHSRLISVFLVRCLDSIIPILALSKISRLASF